MPKTYQTARQMLTFGWAPKTAATQSSAMWYR